VTEWRIREAEVARTWASGDVDLNPDDHYQWLSLMEKRIKNLPGGLTYVIEARDPRKGWIRHRFPPVT